MISQPAWYARLCRPQTRLDIGLAAMANYDEAVAVIQAGTGFTAEEAERVAAAYVKMRGFTPPANHNRAQR